MNKQDQDIAIATYVLNLPNDEKLLQNHEGLWAHKTGDLPAVVIDMEDAIETLKEELDRRDQKQKLDEKFAKWLLEVREEYIEGGWTDHQEGVERIITEVGAWKYLKGKNEP